MSDQVDWFDFHNTIANVTDTDSRTEATNYSNVSPTLQPRSVDCGETQRSGHNFKNYVRKSREEGETTDSNESEDDTENECETCQATDHRGEDCPEFICQNCHQQGHTKNTCPVGKIATFATVKNNATAADNDSKFNENQPDKEDQSSLSSSENLANNSNAQEARKAKNMASASEEAPGKSLSTESSSSHRSDRDRIRSESREGRSVPGKRRRTESSSRTAKTRDSARYGRQKRSRSREHRKSRRSRSRSRSRPYDRRSTRVALRYRRSSASRSPQTRSKRDEPEPKRRRTRSSDISLGLSCRLDSHKKDELVRAPRFDQAAFEYLNKGTSASVNDFRHESIESSVEQTIHVARPNLRVIEAYDERENIQPSNAEHSANGNLKTEVDVQGFSADSGGIQAGSYFVAIAFEKITASSVTQGLGISPIEVSFYSERESLNPEKESFSCQVPPFSFLKDKKKRSLLPAAGCTINSNSLNYQTSGGNNIKFKVSDDKADELVTELQKIALEYLKKYNQGLGYESAVLVFESWEDASAFFNWYSYIDDNDNLKDWKTAVMEDYLPCLSRPAASRCKSLYEKIAIQGKSPKNMGPIHEIPPFDHPPGNVYMQPIAHNICIITVKFTKVENRDILTQLGCIVLSPEKDKLTFLEDLTNEEAGLTKALDKIFKFCHEEKSKKFPTSLVTYSSQTTLTVMLKAVQRHKLEARFYSLFTNYTDLLAICNDLDTDHEISFIGICNILQVMPTSSAHSLVDISSTILSCVEMILKRTNMFFDLRQKCKPISKLYLAEHKSWYVKSPRLIELEPGESCKLTDLPLSKGKGGLPSPHPLQWRRFIDFYTGRFDDVVIADHKVSFTIENTSPKKMIINQDVKLLKVFEALEQLSVPAELVNDYKHGNVCSSIDNFINSIEEVDEEEMTSNMASSSSKLARTGLKVKIENKQELSKVKETSNFTYSELWAVKTERKNVPELPHSNGIETTDATQTTEAEDTEQAVSNNELEYEKTKSCDIEEGDKTELLELKEFADFGKLPQETMYSSISLEDRKSIEVAANRNEEFKMFVNAYFQYKFSKGEDMVSSNLIYHLNTLSSLSTYNKCFSDLKALVSSIQTDITELTSDNVLNYLDEKINAFSLSDLYMMGGYAGESELVEVLIHLFKSRLDRSIASQDGNKCDGSEPEQQGGQTGNTDAHEERSLLTDVEQELHESVANSQTENLTAEERREMHSSDQITAFAEAKLTKTPRIANDDTHYHAVNSGICAITSEDNLPDPGINPSSRQDIPIPEEYNVNSDIHAITTEDNLLDPGINPSSRKDIPIPEEYEAGKERLSASTLSTDPFGNVTTKVSVKTLKSTVVSREETIKTRREEDLNDYRHESSQDSNISIDVNAEDLTRRTSSKTSGQPIVAVKLEKFEKKRKNSDKSKDVPTLNQLETETNFRNGILQESTNTRVYCSICQVNDHSTIDCTFCVKCKNKDHRVMVCPLLNNSQKEVSALTREKIDSTEVHVKSVIPGKKSSNEIVFGNGNVIEMKDDFGILLTEHGENVLFHKKYVNGLNDESLVTPKSFKAVRSKPIITVTSKIFFNNSREIDFCAVPVGEIGAANFDGNDIDGYKLQCELVTSMKSKMSKMRERNASGGEDEMANGRDLFMEKMKGRERNPKCPHFADIGLLCKNFLTAVCTKNHALCHDLPDYAANLIEYCDHYLMGECKKSKCDQEHLDFESLQNRLKQELFRKRLCCFKCNHNLGCSRLTAKEKKAPGLCLYKFQGKGCTKSDKQCHYLHYFPQHLEHIYVENKIFKEKIAKILKNCGMCLEEKFASAPNVGVVLSPVSQASEDSPVRRVQLLDDNHSSPDGRIARRITYDNAETRSSRSSESEETGTRSSRDSLRVKFYNGNLRGEDFECQPSTSKDLRSLIPPVEPPPQPVNFDVKVSESSVVNTNQCTVKGRIIVDMNVFPNILNSKVNYVLFLKAIIKEPKH